MKSRLLVKNFTTKREQDCDRIDKKTHDDLSEIEDGGPLVSTQY